MFQKLLAKIFGTKHARDVKRLQPIAEKINEWRLKYRLNPMMI